jgi:methylated-DNA-[protein]-cysteine S-methyltransferase
MDRSDGIKTRLAVRESPAGPLAVLWSEAGSKPKVVRVFLSKPGLPATRLAAHSHPGAARTSCPEIEELGDGLVAFIRGEDIRFSLGITRMDLCSRFQQAVLKAEHAIPRGRLSTYGRLARRLGAPGGARAVGSCLARNPFPIIVPCHRAICSDRRLGGYQGGAEMKRALLELEGIRFDVSGRAEVAGFFY